MEIGCEAAIWASEEFGSVDLGDKRRTDRLVSISCGLAEQPGATMSALCGPGGAQAVSRLMDCEDVTVKSVISTHVGQTGLRCRKVGEVLALQDTTFLDYTSRKGRVDLGPIGPAKDSNGMLMHSVLALDADKTPLGLLDVNLWARDRESFGRGKDRRSHEVCEKESQKWLDGLAAAERWVCAETPLLVIGDRESDIYSLFVAPRRDNTDLLVRMSQNRALADQEHCHLMDAVDGAKPIGGYMVTVPRRGSRASRIAKLEIRLIAVALKAPRHRTKDVSPVPVKMWIVHAREVDVPDGVEGLEWILLTTRMVDSLEAAVRLVYCYSARWVIEEFHKVLKSGCKVEQMQFESEDRLAPAVAINAVVAWRVLYLSKCARQHPDSAAECICSKTEMLVLSQWLKSKGWGDAPVVTARDFVRGVAKLGGFLGRNSDGEPGTKVLWQGLRRLQDLVAGYQLATGHDM